MNCEPLHHGSRVVNICYKETAELIKQVVRNNFSTVESLVRLPKKLKIRLKKNSVYPGGFILFYSQR